MCTFVAEFSTNQIKTNKNEKTFTRFRSVAAVPWDYGR